ncbi:hypothetical protein ACP70R_007013 [Stipagrostis hirtigluma subsp. patula]
MAEVSSLPVTSSCSYGSKPLEKKGSWVQVGSGAGARAKDGKQEREDEQGRSELLIYGSNLCSLLSSLVKYGSAAGARAKAGKQEAEKMAFWSCTASSPRDPGVEQDMPPATHSELGCVSVDADSFDFACTCIDLDGLEQA